MKKHNGIRPHDVLVLLKILSLGEYSYLKDLSIQLGISPSGIKESVNRSVLAGLISQDKKTVMRNTLYEFLIHGLP
jgi:predicted transcriptional regulator